MFQDYALFPHLTVFDNVAFGLKFRKWPKADIATRVEEMLALVNLAGPQSRYPAQLSGGQQQRVGIARSLAPQPRLLLLDEPLSNLDYKLRIQMRDELRKLQRRLKKTTIYVTHDQAEALALSDRIIVLNAGKVEQVGSPIEIYEKPATTFVADFIGAANLLDGTVEEVTDSSVDIRIQGMKITAERRSTKAVAAGEKAIVMLRPEQISLRRRDNPTGSEENMLPGTIEAITYLGEDIQFSVGLVDATAVVVRMKSSEHAKGFAPGQSVLACFDAKDAQLLGGPR